MDYADSPPILKFSDAFIFFSRWYSADPVLQGGGLTCDDDTVGKVGGKVAALGDGPGHDGGGRGGEHELEKPLGVVGVLHIEAEKLGPAAEAVAAWNGVDNQGWAPSVFTNDSLYDKEDDFSIKKNSRMPSSVGLFVVVVGLLVFVW